MNRILLVDDEPNVLSALKRLLAQAFHNEGLVIETFADARAALVRGKEVPFDMVLSDFRMPIMDGVTFLKQFRELQPDTPRLILSATTDFDTLMAAVNEAAILRYLVKPWDEDELIASLREALAHHADVVGDRLLANQMRENMGLISEEEKELRRLEVLEPGITQVRRSPDGAILLDDL